ncbi:hypothetical protein [Flavobacterium luteolum]|uniref:hypothetical protein n=1 Tax=Flavobacterium luteolum TaxID=3003259 RepID=UPI00248DD989|nr:hypothetical protein [Flavobacterium luteolum]
MSEFEDEIFKRFELSHRGSVQIDLYSTASQNLKLFEESIKKTLTKHENKHNKMCEKASDISEKISELQIDLSGLDYEEKHINLQNKIYELQEKGYSYYIESYWIDQQLKAISEMQIINAFKNLEINIKSLIYIAYPEINLKDFYKWENLVQFFKSKNIKMAEIEGYKEMVDLKSLNNVIKHIGQLNVIIRKIEEFKGAEELNYVSLINFYERIKNIIETFLRLLVIEIEKELFQFDEDRIIEIAKDLKNRMELNEIESLILKLKND